MSVDNSRIAKNTVYLYIRMILVQQVGFRSAPKNGGFYPISAAQGKA